MNHSELLYNLDKKYFQRGPDRVECPNSGKVTKLPQSGASYRDHGCMVVHGSGQYLVCGICGAQHPVGL